MNITIFADALERVKEFHDGFQSASELEKLATAATNAGGNATHQQAYVDEKKRILEDAVSRADLFVFDYQLHLIQEAGLAELIPSRFIEDLRSLISENENTLNVLGTELQSFKTRVSEKLNSITTLIQSLKELNVAVDFLEEGDAAIIVRFGNFADARKPRKFAKDLDEALRMIESICSDVSGERQEVTLIAISNPTPTVVIGTILGGVLAFCTAMKAIGGVASLAQELRGRQIDLKTKAAVSAALIQKLETHQEADKQLMDEIIKERIGQIASDLYKGTQKNGQLGLAKNLKRLVQFVQTGVSFDTIAIPHEEAPSEDDANDVEVQKLLEEIAESSGVAEQLKILREDPDLVALLTHDDDGTSP